MENLLLIHGAIGAADQLQALKEMLQDDYHVYILDLSGHGGRPFANEPFSIVVFAKDVLQFMEEQNISSTSIFGYSMGGYIAMYLAKHHPEKINKLITLATKYAWSVEIAAREIQMLQAEKIAAKLPAFAAILEKRHHPNDWKGVLQQTADMMVAMGKQQVLNAEDYNAIQTQVLLLLGDRDKMVSLEETVAMYKLLPNAQMGMIPNTPHPIEQVDMQLLSFLVKRFI